MTKFRIFDNDNNIFDFIDLLDIDDTIITLEQYFSYFSGDYMNTEYTTGDDGPKYDLPTLNPFWFNLNNEDIYVGDIVMAVNRNGTQHTAEVVMIDNEVFLKKNQGKQSIMQLLNPKKCVIKKVGTIYDKYLK